MRGIDEKPTQLFSYVDLERRIPLDHPLRAIRALVDKVLAGQSRTFGKLYAHDGRPGIPPERLLRALLLQAFYSVRSERLLIEQLDYNLLFRWAFRRMIRYGTQPSSARTVTASWEAMWRLSSWRGC